MFQFLNVYSIIISVMKLQEKTLWQNIKSGNFLPVYLIKGNEGYLKQKYASLIADSVVPAGLEAFNFHKLKGEDTSVEEIATCVEALPAMCDRTCVFVHDFDFDGAGEREKEQLCEVLSDLPETCVLVFWQDTKGFSVKTKLSKEILSLIDKAGAVCDIDKREQKDLVKFIVSECEKRERNIDYDTALYFFSSVGDDMANLINEIEKVCAYTSSVITEKDVDAVAIKCVEATAFQMVDQLLANNFDKAFASMASLFEQRVEAHMILGALTSTYVDIYRVRVAMDYGHSAFELKELFPTAYRSDFKLRKASNAAKKFSLAGAGESLEVLSRADFKLKSSFQDNRVIMEQLLIELAKARRIP